MAMPWERDYEEEEQGPWSIDYSAVAPPRRAAKPARDPTPADLALAESSVPGRVLIGLGSRFSDIGQGLKQTTGLVADALGAETGWAQDIAQRQRDEAPFKQAIRRDPAALAGGILGDVAAAVPMAGVMRGPVLGSAVIGAGLAGPMTPRENPSFEALAGDTATGGVLGGAGGAAMQGLAGSIGRAKNAATGRFGTPELGDRARAFKEWGVEPSIGDLTQNPIVMSAENIAGYFPFTGRTAFLANQTAALKKAASDVTPKVLGRQGVSSKEDISTVLANSIKAKYASNKRTASQMYDAVERAAKDPTVPPVQPISLAQNAAALRNEYPDLFNAFQDKQAVSRLNSIIEGTGPRQSAILGPNGLPIQTPPQLSFSDARWLDKRLGSMIRQGDKQVMAGNMDPEAFRQLAQLQRSLRADIDDWALSTGRPDIVQGIKDANKYFRENIVPFREDATIRGVLQDRLKPDVLPQRLFGGDNPIYAGKARQFLTPEGELAGKEFILEQGKKKAMEAALSPRASFLRPPGLTGVGETGAKVLSPEELARFAQFEELLHAGRRAIGSGSDPSQQARLLSIAGLSKPVFPAVGKAFTSLGSGVPMRWLLADPRLYTGSSPLGRVSEQALRSSGVGLGLKPIREHTDE